MSRPTPQPEVEPVPAERARELAGITARMLAGRGLGVAAHRIAIARSAHSSSCSLYEVDLLDAPEGIPPLLLKDLSPSSRTPEAAGIRPAHLDDPLREIAVYRRILAPAGVGVRYFGAAFDRHTRRSLLLIERVEAMALDYVGDFDAWRAAARAIGALHRRFPEHAIDRKWRRHLVEVDGRDLDFWIERAAHTTKGTHPDAGSESTEGRSEVALESHPLAAIVAHRAQLRAAFDRLPRSLAHGELYASNILVDGAGIYPVDWELASIAPGALDIAALTSGTWSADERRSLVDAWREGIGVDADAGLRSVDHRRTDDPASEAAVELARLYLALRLVGWSNAWTPPADEQHDWLAEALAAFERLREGLR